MSERNEIGLSHLVDAVRAAFGPDTGLFLSWCDDPEIADYSYVVCDVRRPGYDVAFAHRLRELQSATDTPAWFLLTSRFR